MASSTKPSNTINIFSFVNSIGENKEYIYSDDTSAEYSAYMINRAMSNHPDCLFLANEMNKYSQVPNNSQYDFYFYSVPKKKRYGKWAKAEKVPQLELIMEVYGYSRAKAEQVLDLLTPEQLTIMENRHGGRTK